MPHPPENGKAYCLWNYAVDKSARAKKLRAFMRESSEHPEDSRPFPFSCRV